MSTCDFILVIVLLLSLEVLWNVLASESYALSVFGQLLWLVKRHNVKVRVKAALIQLGFKQCLLLHVFEIKFEALSKVFEVEELRLVQLLLIKILLHLHFSLKLMEDVVVVALNITCSTRVRHSILVESLILSHLLHPGKVSQDLTLRKVRGLIPIDIIHIRNVLFLLCELLHKLLIELFSFLLLLHVEEAPWCTVLTVLPISDHSDDHPDRGKYCWSQEVLSRCHVYKHNF